MLPDPPRRQIFARHCDHTEYHRPISDRFPPLLFPLFCVTRTLFQAVISPSSGAALAAATPVGVR
jgi:hypothetical protein